MKINPMNTMSFQAKVKSTNKKLAPMGKVAVGTVGSTAAGATSASTGVYAFMPTTVLIPSIASAYCNEHPSKSNLLINDPTDEPIDTANNTEEN